MARSGTDLKMAKQLASAAIFVKIGGVISMEEEEVSLVDGVFEGAFGALALEMEALVDSIEQSGLSLEEKIIILFKRNGNVIFFIIECDEWMKKRRNDGLCECHGRFELEYNIIYERGTMAGVDVDTLTMEQYLALSRENQAPAEDTFSGNKDEDAHDHIDQVDRLAPGTINTWDLFKKAFIQGYCPPSMTTKQLEIFTTLSKKETNHYIKLGSDIITCYTSALPTTSIIIQRTTSKKIESSSSNDGLAALVGFQICKGPRLDKDFTLNEEVKQVEEVRCREFGRTAPFNGNNGGKFHVGPPGYYTKIDNRSPYGEKRQSLEDLLAKHQEESTRRSTKMKGWIKKLQENAEINTRNQNASLKNLETQIEQLTKEIHSNKILNSSSEQIKTVTSDQETSRLNKLHGVSFISGPESNTPEILQHQLPPKELTPRSFTLPCTIGKFNFYIMADLGASINVMPMSIFKHLHLTNLKKINMLCEMADMSKKAPLGIVENVLVKIDKFLFPSDFVIFDNTPSETTILGRPFLATIHAKIDVFAGKI
ncbi:MAK10-like protein [Tanacetum coccineum]